MLGKTPLVYKIGIIFSPCQLTDDCGHRKEVLTHSLRRRQKLTILKTAGCNTSKNFSSTIIRNYIKITIGKLLFSDEALP